MVSRDRIVEALDTYLDAQNFQDAAPIGLQVEGADEVQRVTLGVSACLELFREAVARKAQMVVVHHGMFWKNESQVIRGPLRERIRFLLNHELTLLAYHLPLDAHLEAGNNARLVAHLEARRGEPFGLYHGVPIGFEGLFDEPVPLRSVADRLAALTGRAPLVLTGGKSEVRRFGVVSGGAGDLFPQAIERRLDLFVTGEPYEPAQAFCRETGIHFIALGHYNSETLGVKALSGWLANELRLEAEFVDIPNPA